MSKSVYFLLSILILAASAAGIACDAELEGETDGELERPLAGGETTTFDRSSSAFTNPAANLTEKNLEHHFLGDVRFENQFVSAPATVNPGLGPVFNNTSCLNCHTENGRGMPAVGNRPGKSQALVRVSLPADRGDPELPGGPVPVPGVGTQIQDQAIYGVAAEAVVEIDWVEYGGSYGDGTAYTLREPVVTLTPSDGGSFDPEMMTSLRIPPPVHGLGLLEALDEETILAAADPDDADGDGISGRPNYVYDVQSARTVMGRFGLKANQPNLLQQAAGAYRDDMGVGNPLFPDEDEEGYDIDFETLEATAFYTQTLGVPARVDWADVTVRRGERLFEAIGCASCHTPTMTTGDHEIAELSRQTIHAYTDLLLHDMGPGLADGRPDFEATGSEWRTAPLWGLGLAHTVLPLSGLLHDGRAGSIEEAILWHGGEADGSREAFRTMSASDREALLAFLRSL
ncbi:MAG: thiol oxidoreductase [Deltaproteobacteria bacterium]|nr:thiol oxidoreductase [Deltaproteobacteria bacterium]